MFIFSSGRFHAPERRATCQSRWLRPGRPRSSRSLGIEIICLLHYCQGHILAMSPKVKKAAAPSAPKGKAHAKAAKKAAKSAAGASTDPAQDTLDNSLSGAVKAEATAAAEEPIVGALTATAVATLPQETLDQKIERSQFRQPIESCQRSH